jgi:large subunit ribosomal protein L25
MTLELKAEIRDVFGKKLKNFRKEGKLPAVLYGRKKETTPLFVDLKEFKKVWKEAGESSIIKLQDENVIIQDVSVDPVKNEPLHVDFYAVEMDKPIEATIPLIFEGTAAAEKELGGILVKVMYEVEVEALPRNLPHELKVDISKLKVLDDQITVKDIELPAGVKILTKEDEVVALIEEPKEEFAEKPLSIEEVEVEKKGKKPAEGEAEEVEERVTSNA